MRLNEKFGTVEFQRGNVKVTPETGGINPPEILPNKTAECKTCNQVREWVNKNPIPALVVGFFILRLLFR